ncbi:MAG: homoaconitate hydratase family protein [Candidatus Altiarchaeales archaeon]|nr:homoaconitate hydratase family protein [Candidatus Altiarchaeales archaeon]
MATISEKILSQHANAKTASAGDIVECEIDYVMVNDVTGLPAFKAFEKIGAEPKREKIVLIPDHYVPNKDVASANQAKAMADFARKHGIPNYFEVGRGGVCHQIMLEEGFAAPGRLIVGADSHTCSYGAVGCFATGVGSTEAATVMASGELWFKVPETQKFTVEGELPKYSMGKDIILHVIGEIGVDGSLYKAQEWYGSTIEDLSIAERISISNMAIEAGGKAGLIPADDKTIKYLKNRVRGDFNPVYADEDASYVEAFEYEASEIVPTVAGPPLPENAKPACEVDVEIDQAYLGSCTNGRIEDMRVAAEILKGRRVKEGVRMIVVPASKRVMDEMIAEGLYRVFSEAGAYVSGPTCGACLGGYMGVLAKDEVAVSSTNRNFIGRMGHKDSKVYLASPATVAASAATGKITDPRELG